MLTVGTNAPTAQIPPTVAASDLQNAISAAAGCQVTVYTVGKCVEWCNIYVNFNQIPGNVPLITVSSNSLTGGSTGTTPSLTVSRYITGSNNVFQSPIPGELFFTAHDTPQVTVTVNGVTSSCQDHTCDITITSAYTPTLTAYTYTAASNLLTVTVTPPSGVTPAPTILPSALTISFGAQPCTPVTTTSTAN